MNLRAAILALADKHNLSPDAGFRLKQLAALDAPPSSLLRYLPFGLAVLSAVLVGLAIVFWVAANWDALPRSLRFTLIEAIVFATLAGAWRFPVPAYRCPCWALSLAAACSLTLARPTKPAPPPGSCLPYGRRSPCRCAWACGTMYCGCRG